jgi:VanZ family protein
LPGADLPHVGFRSADKLVHFTMYGVFGWLAARAFFRPGRAVWIALAVVLAVSLFGAADEWHQQFIPGRSMEFFDWMSDTVGATLGATIGVLTAARARRERRA